MSCFHLIVIFCIIIIMIAQMERAFDFLLREPSAIIFLLMLAGIIIWIHVGTSSNIPVNYDQLG